MEDKTKEALSKVYQEIAKTVLLTGQQFIQIQGCFERNYPKDEKVDKKK